MFNTFLLDYYDGRALDKYKTKENGFCNLLEWDHQVMADIGFEVPPGAQMKSHMTSAEVKYQKSG